LPGVTKREVKLADRMRWPGRCGASERTTVSTSGSSGNVDQNLAFLNFHGILGELYVLIEVVAARAAVILPRVPWAHQHVAVERAMTQRPSGMTADALQRMQFVPTLQMAIARSPNSACIADPGGKSSSMPAFTKAMSLLYHGVRAVIAPQSPAVSYVSAFSCWF
jgi:hypothetical protein